MSVCSFGSFKKRYKRKHHDANIQKILHKYTKGIHLKFGTQTVEKYIFYDDDERNIDDVSVDVRIKSILLPRRQLPDGTKGSLDTYSTTVVPEIDYYTHLQHEYGGEQFTGHQDLKNYIEKIIIPSGNDEPHVSEGLSTSYMEECKIWATQLYEREHGNPKEYYGAVFFDFDRVINLCEGFTTLDTPKEMLQRFQVIITGVLKYIIGSPKRLQDLRDFFNFLISKKIRLCILTNNQGCNTMMFRSICMLLHNSFGNNIFCCTRKPSKLICIYDSGVLESVN
jgi:hypothetical protein